MLSSILREDEEVRVALQPDQKSEHNSFVITIQYKMEYARLSEISVNIADSLKYTRQDLHLKEFSTGSIPFNWIATIPLEFKKYPVVTVVLNDDNYQHEVRKGNFEIKIIFNDTPYMIGVIFKDTLYKDYYFASTRTAEIMNNHVINQLGRLENMLNVSCIQTKTICSDCNSVLKNLCMCDDMLFRNDLYIKKKLASCRLDTNSTIINDMSCAERIQSGICGNVSREDVLKTIIFDKILYLQEERYADKPTDAYLTIINVYKCVIALGRVTLKFAELCELLEKYKSLKQLSNNLRTLVNIRCKLILSFLDNDERNLDWPIFYSSLMCVDNCILHNIDALCGTKKHLHGYCLFESIVLQSPTPTATSKMYKTLSQDAMNLRTEFDHSNLYGQTLQKFAIKKTSVCRQMWKLTVCATINLYLRVFLLPKTKPIFIHMIKIQQPENFQFIFEPDSTVLYTEGKYREMLRMILQTNKEITEEQKNSIMTYETDSTIIQLHFKDEMKDFFDQNNLIWNLMTKSHYTPPSVVDNIDTMWEQLSSRTH